MKMTQEEKEYLKSLAFREYTFKEICELYWKKFDNKRTENALSNWFYKKLKLKGFNPQNKYTKEEHDYIKENIHKFRKNGCFDENAFIEDYNSKFEHKIDRERLLGLRHRLNICLEKIDFNEWVSSKDCSKHPLGSEVMRNGQTYVKINHIIDPTIDKNELWKLNWKNKARMLYEEYHNVSLNEDDIIIFLDKNQKNFSKDNLYCINRKTQGYLISYQHIQDVELRKTAVKICEIQEKLNGRTSNE